MVVFFVRVGGAPRSTSTATLVPYTTLFRSPLDLARCRGAAEIRRQTKLLEADEDAGRARHDAGANQHVRCDASRCWGKTQVLDPTAQKLAHQGHGLGVENPPPRSDLHRSEEHTSELQSLMRISYAVFCLKKKKYHN